MKNERNICTLSSESNHIHAINSWSYKCDGFVVKEYEHANLSTTKKCSSFVDICFLFTILLNSCVWNHRQTSVFTPFLQVMLNKTYY